MNSLHPALAFLQDSIQPARALGADTLVLDIDGTHVEILVVQANAGPVFFTTGRTRLSYRCRSGLPAAAKEHVRRMLLDLKRRLTAGYVADPQSPLPEGGGWTDRIHDGDLGAWQDWATRNYRRLVEAGQRDVCSGLPDCLDLHMRPPIQPPWREVADAPRSGPCSQCGRARGCHAARERDAGNEGLKPLRYADAGGAEIAALQALSEAAAVPLARALDAYAVLAAACGDRSLDGALALEFSVRLPAAERQPDRLRFVSYYPLVADDAVRHELNRGRRVAARTLAAHWLTPPETTALDAWLDCAAHTQPATLGLSIGVELDAAGIRLQVYAHPGPHDGAEHFARAAVGTLGGAPNNLPTSASGPVLVGIALCANQPAALKLYYHRAWDGRSDTGLLPDGMGALAPFNPGWGLAVQEHADGRAAWVKWDFPVATHYQVYDRFLAAFWQAGSERQEAVPDWLSGERFSPWPTWASLGRGGRALYFQAR
jgi:hypothetical protein